VRRTDVDRKTVPRSGSCHVELAELESTSCVHGMNNFSLLADCRTVWSDENIVQRLAAVSSRCSQEHCQ